MKINLLEDKARGENNGASNKLLDARRITYFHSTLRVLRPRHLNRSTASLAIDEITLQTENCRMSLYTHWACFNCRKSFHRRPLENQTSNEATEVRKCPDCASPTVDMGVYFEPPPRRATKQWMTMQLLAESGYKFQTEGSKAYIESFILQTKRPRFADARETIAAEQQAKEACRTESRLKLQKEEKAQRKRAR